MDHTKALEPDANAETPSHSQFAGFPSGHSQSRMSCSDAKASIRLCSRNATTLETVLRRLVASSLACSPGNAAEKRRRREQRSNASSQLASRAPLSAKSYSDVVDCRRIESVGRFICFPMWPQRPMVCCRPVVSTSAGRSKASAAP
eukprot:scaffold3403_cov300-Pinguiococcus_pyrenoidosus.AAC.6